MLTNAVLLLAGPAAGVAAGFALGGRLGGLATIRLRALWLLWLAAGVQAAQYYVVPRFLGADNAASGPGLLAVVFAIVAVWLGVNLHQPDRLLRAAGVTILLGAALNAAAILANGSMLLAVYLIATIATLLYTIGAPSEMA